MEINDVIFKELVKRGFSIKGDKKIWDVSDSKLWYITPKQAQGYLDFQGVTEYASHLGSKETALMRESLPSITNFLGKEPINIVDLGCGDGKKALVIIQELKNKMPLRYYPIDISGYMVEKAIDKISKLEIDEIVESQYNISDFENLENITPLLVKGKYKKNVFLLLGNTLGNFEFHEMLFKLRNVMGNDDFLIIGNGLNNDKISEGVLKFCKNTPQWKSWHDNVPLQLGFSLDEIIFDVRFAHSRLESYYTVTRDKTVNHLNKLINFKKGDEIIVGVCWHFKKNEFKTLMNLYFNTAEIYTAKDDSYALAVCKK